jgi:hypothetical protein
VTANLADGFVSQNPSPFVEEGDPKGRLRVDSNQLLGERVVRSARFDFSILSVASIGSLSSSDNSYLIS